MEKGRLEAFTDGVVAIIITIMVLEIKTPTGDDLASLRGMIPIFLAYILSFVNIGIFWNNHHHMLQVTRHVDGKVLWANLFMLFWLSLVPFVIRWMDEAHFSSLPTAAYGVVLAMSALGYTLLERAIVARNGRNSALATAVGADTKAWASLVMYISAVPLAFVHPLIAFGLYILVAIIWVIPDQRIERIVDKV